MSISSSSYYSVSTSTSKGISGLASGLDTESMVKKMLAGTQAKIDKQEALKQQTLWKQQIYQDVIKSINGFYGKYFDTSYGSTLQTNFASASFFDSMTTQVKSGDAVSIVGTSTSALSGEMRIAVKELASAASMVSDQKMSVGKTLLGSAVTADALNAQFDRTLVLRVDEQNLSIDLNQISSTDEMVAAINRAFSDANLSGVTARLQDGALRIVTDSAERKIALGSGSTTLGLKAAGLSASRTAEVKAADGTVTGNMLQGGTPEPASGLSFDLTFNGATKTITLNPAKDGTGKVTLDTVRDELQAQVKKAFGDYITVGTKDGKLEFSLNVGGQTGHELRITGADAAKIGFTPGASTLIGGSTKLSELGLAGDRAVFTINGTRFSFDGSATVSEMVNKINTSDAGVRILYSSLSDTFRMEATATGAQHGIDISQLEGNLFNKLFGDGKFSAAGSVAAKTLTTGTVAGKAGGLADTYTTKGASLSMTVNGASYTFKLPEKTNTTYSKSDIEAAFGTWLTATFGQSEGGVSNISYSGGNLVVAEGYEVRFAQTKTDTEDAKAMAAAEATDLALAFGFSTRASSNVAGADTLLADVRGLNGLDMRDADGNAAVKLGDIRSINGHAVTFSDGKLVLSGAGAIDLSDSAALQAIFGGASLTLGSGSMQGGAVKAGTEARISVNGTDVFRSSNVFTIDGVTMELTKLSGTNASGDYVETVVSSARDTEKIVEAFKTLVQDYNTMLDKLNGYVGAESNYRKYAPLTSEQKKEMSEKEIELWEQKAKEGLVRNDSIISDFLAQMRNTLYSKPSGSSLALYNVGVETKGWEDKGKLSLDESALRNALSTDPEAVKRLFIDSAEGLAGKITSISNATAKISVGTPGTLVKLAGVEGWSATAKNNALYDQIRSIEDRLKDLQTKYSREESRYTSQFSYMEKILASYNTQSSMVSQYFTSGQ